MDPNPLNYSFIDGQTFDTLSNGLPTLSQHFLSQGEVALLNGDLSGLDFFDKALELEASNPHLYFRQGIALFEFGSRKGEEKILLQASKKFKAALALDKEYFDAWYGWGMTLLLLGQTYHEHHYFQEAEEKLKNALAFSQKKSPDVLADLYWDYATVWTHLGEHSGEAVDFRISLEAYQKAYQYQATLPEEFWNSYGKTCLHMASLLNDVRLIVKAIHCFRHSVSIALSSFESWALLARAFSSLYAYTHDEDHYAQAMECFTSASHLKAFDKELWYNWANFLCEAGAQTRDLKRLRACVEKCQNSHAYEAYQPLLMGIWAEALALLGEMTDNVALLYEAQHKITRAVEDVEEEDPLLWYSFGMCMNAFGRYFKDNDYFYQAIEKFQYGLSLDRTCHRLWHVIAKTYAHVGKEEDDQDAFEKAVRFSAKALAGQFNSSYIFSYAFALSNLGEMKEDKELLERAATYYEHLFNLQKNALYTHPEWLFHYATTLDILGDYHDEESYYLKSIEILSQVLMVDPDFPHIHHRLSLAHSHLGELKGETEYFYRAIHHSRIAVKNDEENDQIIVDWGVTLINLAQHLHLSEEIETLYFEAEHKLIQAARLGNQQAFYHLGCLYSLLGQYEKAIFFINKCHQVNALPNLEEILEDEWLDGLRDTEYFHQFLSYLERKLEDTL